MAEVWAEWGWLAYAAAFAWAFCEGETFVLVAAAAGAATGLIDPWVLMLSVWGGSFAGDQLWFALGRRYGPRALRRAPAAERGLAAAAAPARPRASLAPLSAPRMRPPPADRPPWLPSPAPDAPRIRLPDDGFRDDLALARRARGAVAP